LQGHRHQVHQKCPLPSLPRQKARPDLPIRFIPLYRYHSLHAISLYYTRAIGPSSLVQHSLSLTCPFLLYILLLAMETVHFKGEVPPRSIVLPGWRRVRSIPLPPSKGGQSQATADRCNSLHLLPVCTGAAVRARALARLKPRRITQHWGICQPRTGQAKAWPHKLNFVAFTGARPYCIFR
jgi:hypothetical protein